jgi:hypothetical protein
MDMLDLVGQPLDSDGGVADLDAAGVVMGSLRRWRRQAAGGPARRGKGAGKDTFNP